MRLSRKTMQLVTAGDQREEPLAQKTAERQALIEKRKEQLYEAIARSFTPVGAPITLGSGSEALRFPVASTYSTREEIIQGCRAQQQFCSRQAEENAQTARMVENMGDWATSQRLWERAAHNQGLSDYFGQAAARYESATAPMTAPQPTAPSPTQEEEEPEEALSYEENLRLAMDSYNRYKETGTVEDHELTLAYVDDMLEYYERERDSAEATMSNMPLVGLMSWTYKDKKVWDYVEAAGDDPDPTELARIIEEALPRETSISQSPALDYLNRSVEQILLGNFSDENTLLGTAGQFGLSLLGYDLPMDVRDLVYDWTHLQTTPWYQTLIDTLALLPVVGAIKPVANGLETALDTFKVFDRAGNAMEATSDALKTAERAGETMDAAADAGKNADELVETGDRASDALKTADQSTEAAETATDAGKHAEDPGAQDALDLTKDPEYNKYIEKLEEAGRVAAESEHDGYVTYYRVQGGTGQNSSKELISVQENGRIQISQANETDVLYVSAYNTDHASYFKGEHRGPDSEIVAFDIPKWLDDFIREEMIPQKNYTKNPLNQSQTAPMIVDPSKNGYAYGLPSIWYDWLEEYAVNSRIIATGDIG